MCAVPALWRDYDIDVTQIKSDRPVIVSAITLGVVAKAVLIGGVLALAWRDPLFLILGVAVAAGRTGSPAPVRDPAGGGHRAIVTGWMLAIGPFARP